MLVVLHEPALGGATIALLRLVPLLEELGWRFAFWVPSGAVVESELRDRGYPVGSAPRLVYYSLRALRLDPGVIKRLGSVPGYLRALRGFARELSPAVIHLNSMMTLADLLAVRSIAPTTLHVHEMIPPTLKGAVTKRVASTLATEVMAASTSCADALSHGAFRPHVVHSSAAVPPMAELERDDLPLIVGTVGMVQKIKGTDTFLDAVEIVAAKLPAVRFELIGAPSSGVDAVWARDQIARAIDLGVEYRSSADVGAAMSRWSIFAMASRRDTFPLAMLEAMSMGISCVGARSEGLAEQLADGAGILVDVDDAKGLAAAVERLAVDPELRWRLGSAARARVAECFSPGLAASKVDRVYRLACRPAAAE